MLSPLPEVAQSGTPSRAGRDVLRAIGEDLDRDIYPVVHTNGAVMPDSSRLSTPSGEEIQDAYHAEARPARSEAGPGQGSAGGGPSAEGSEARFLCHPGLAGGLAERLEWAAAAYPTMRVRVAPPVVWLLTRNHPILGLPDEALTLTGLPIDLDGGDGEENRPFVSWAWWDVGIWIGPRHTNFGDGSICSFEPSHGTWRPGDSIVTLLDLHAVWVARHLHLRHFGRWPGKQILHTAHERVIDQRPGELCGCGSLRQYSACHQASDRGRTRYERLSEFTRRYPNPKRGLASKAWAELRKTLSEASLTQG
jgi:hypothetical protein